MKSYEVLPLFPTPVYTSELETNFDFEKIISSVQEMDMYTNVGGNFTSVESYLFDLSEFQDIGVEVQNHLNRFVKDFLKKPSLEISVTQSWLNVNPPGAYHHEHNHPNSAYSGVIWLSPDPEPLIFLNPPEMITTHHQTEEVFWANAHTHEYETKQGGIAIFPSTLRHWVPQTGNKTRYGIAFNTFYKGSIGSKMKMTELKITD